MPILSAMEGAVSQGILWGLMTLGVYFTFRMWMCPKRFGLYLSAINACTKKEYRVC